jgi:hypothetical protein
MASVGLDRRSPLGLPSGSIRALLTLVIVAVVAAEVVRGRAVATLWQAPWRENAVGDPHRWQTPPHSSDDADRRMA